jgi:hypothetical protein
LCGPDGQNINVRHLFQGERAMKLKIFLYCVLMTAIYIKPLRADIVNGGFENAFDQWTFTYFGESPSIVQSTPSDPAPQGQYYAHLFADASIPPGERKNAHIFMDKTFSALAGETLTLKYRAFTNQYADSDFYAMAHVGIDISRDGIPFYYTQFYPSYPAWNDFVCPAFVADGDYSVEISVWADSMEMFPPYHGGMTICSAYLDLDSVQLVPEPSVFILLGMGCLALLFIRRKI